MPLMMLHGIILERGSRVSLRRQLAGHLESRILGGQIGPGRRLPSVRRAEELLGLHRNTVAAAYRDLVQAGLARTRPGSGVYVRSPGCPDMGVALVTVQGYRDVGLDCADADLQGCTRGRTARPVGGPCAPIERYRSAGWDPIGAGHWLPECRPDVAKAFPRRRVLRKRSGAPSRFHRRADPWRGRCGLSAFVSGESRQHKSREAPGDSGCRGLRRARVGQAPPTSRGGSVAPHLGLFLERTGPSSSAPRAGQAFLRARTTACGTIPANECRRTLIRCGESSIIGARCRTAALARGVIGNTPDSGSGESRFEPWRAN